MLRWLYIRLIWLHPAPFRRRFGDQMLDIFDGAARRVQLRYLADAVASLGRQWALRPEFRRPDPPAAAAVTPGAPLFQTIEAYRPHPVALLQGGMLAILWITFAVILIVRGGGMARPFLIGSHFSRPGLLPVDPNSVTGSDLNTTVMPGPDPFDAWLKVARPYFSSMPVLFVLDRDRDLTLPPPEIAAASAALRLLDTNHDGKLAAEECGLHIDPNSMSPTALAKLRRRFMSYHPVLAALDADRDGEISAWEIEHAAASLKNLDRNHDGYLTAGELLPSEIAAHVNRRE